jgi:cytochrome b6-f complex iron-sulfur subunit
MKSPNKKTSERKKPGKAAEAVSRRSFLTILWTVLGLAALAEFLWIAFSFLRPAKPQGAINHEIALIDAGAPASFPPGSVTAFQKGEFYIVRLDDGGFLALSCKCTHLGCTVAWVEKEKKFLCPCHASAFDITGSVIHSPATRPLDFFPVTFENNIVRVDAVRRTRRGRFDSNQVVHPPKG